MHVESNAILIEPMMVHIVQDEIVLISRWNESFSPSAARETGQRLIAAADKLDAKYIP